MQAAIRAEIERLKSEDVTDEELAKFKTRAKADLLRALRSNQGLADQLADHQRLYGDWRELFRSLDRIDKVTKADIRRVASEVFQESNRTVASSRRWRQPPQPAADAAAGGRPMRPTDSAPLPPGLVPPGHPPSPPPRPRSTAPTTPLPAAPRFDIPQPQRVVLDNGLVVLLLEDHELPLVEATALVRAGSRLEPAAKVGLAELAGEVLRTGGTERMTGDQLDDLLESRAAAIETAIGETSRPRLDLA